VADILKMDEFMSQKKVKRAQILGLLKESKISQQKAACPLGITTRQVRRLARCYQAAGFACLNRTPVQVLNWNNSR
jgi:transcriptional regulator with GAF, ATPase, and Fis domain